MGLIQPPQARPVHKPPMTATEHHAKGALCAAVATRDPLRVAAVLAGLAPTDAARLILEVADDAAADRIRTADRMRRLKDDRDCERAEHERWKERCARAELDAAFAESEVRQLQRQCDMYAWIDERIAAEQAGQEVGA